MNRSEVKGLIKEALEQGLTPIVHPNGFIQLKLVDGRRMHFWHENIPRQKRPSPIHDHIFTMHSEIVAGSILHSEISVSPDSDGFYDLYEARPIRDTETELVSTGKRVRADHGHWQKFDQGEEYEFMAERFHETDDRLGPAITIITKLGEVDAWPRVLVPHGSQPDNEFTRDSFGISTVLGMIEVVTDNLLPRIRH